MRLRHVKNGFEILRAHLAVITQPENYNYELQNIFNNNNPIHIELGSGKGKFIREISKLNKEINYFGFEKDTKVIYRWLKEIEFDYDNSYYIVHSNADMLTEIFTEKAIDRIYLNFSDPWPKPRRYKRRLTHKRFLDMYKHILKVNGEIHFKTDNNDLFEYSVEQFKKNNWNIVLLTRDLYNSYYLDGNVSTEYEEKFVSEGKKINKIIVKLEN